LLGRKFPTIEEAEKAGYKVADLAISHADLLEKTWRAKEMNRLINAINENPELSLSTKQAPEEWVELEHRAFPSGKNRRYTPTIASAIEDLTWASSPHALVKAYDNFNHAMKLIGFYNPFVMTKNDMFQGWRASGTKFFINIPKGVRIWRQKGAKYNELRKYGLFNNIINYTPAVEELTQRMLDQIEKSKGRRVAAAIGRVLNPKNIITNIEKFNETFTWNIDEMLRIATFESLKDGRLAEHFGKDAFQLAELSNDFLANYGKVPRRTRQIFNRAFFTPTYRISMARIFTKMWSQPAVFWPQLARHYAYKLFVWYILPGLAGLWIAGRWSKGHIEKGYRVVVKGKSGKEYVFSLSDPLLEEAKLTQRPLLWSLELNLSASLHFLVNALRGPKFKNPRDKFGHLFKLGTPFWRDIERMADEDRTTLQKILNQMAIAFAYTRKERKVTDKDRDTAVEALAKAVSIWTDWKEQKEDIKRRLGLPKKKQPLISERRRELRMEK